MKKNVWFAAQLPRYRPFINRIQPVSLIFFVLGVLIFGACKATYRVNQAIEGALAPTTLIDIAENTSFALAGFDKDLARFSNSLTRVINTVLSKQPMFPNETESFDNVLEYLAQGGSRMTHKQLAARSRFPLVQKLASFSGDVRSLLGEEQEQTYLIVLQNIAEKRPNGGFFGSFALIKLKHGQLSHVEILDSYLPAFDRPHTFITGPERMEQFLPGREIHFVGANKVGFTYHDGANIKTLYEKSYPWQKIRGIIFLRTDMFEKILPGFTQQLRERQFVNAATDLIRGADKRWKKELYLKSSQEYFSEHALTLAKATLQKLPDLIAQRYINIYLTDISGSFHTFLRTHNLTTRFENTHAYFRDSNISFNKSDRFVHKLIQCIDSTQSTKLVTQEDIVNISNLNTGTYQCSIRYSMDIPQEYISYIQSLEAKYNITLTEREMHILALDRNRATRGVIHVPPYATITNLSGAHYEWSIFKTPFSNAATYKTTLTPLTTQNTVLFDLTINKQ